MKKIVLTATAVVFAFLVLFVSIFDSSAITYPVSNVSQPPEINQLGQPVVDYPLPYAGRVLPDSPFWWLKALRDKVWFGITPSHTRKAEIALLFADKRLVMSRILFEKGEPGIAISTYTKGEKYLSVAIGEEEAARKENADTSVFLTKLALSALKHMEVSMELKQIAPDDAKAVIVEMEKYSNEAYDTAKRLLNGKQLLCPINPFVRD